MSRLRPALTRALIGALTVTSAVLVAVGGQRPAAAVDGAGGTSYYVTIVARQCPSYDAIMANRARNNIQESLRDLGPNSRYSAGQPVDPSVEEPAQPLCTPLSGRVFTMGRGIDGKVENLTTVSGADPSTPATHDNVPLLAPDGSATGRTINGAVTVELTAAQLARAQRGNSLWIQSGTPGDPLPDPTVHGFGALRCAVDNLNGDNVEWIGFPNTYRHVFCYYLTVSLPPPPGTIRVVKTVPSGSGDVTERFPFTGNISYNPGGAFQIGMVNGEAAGVEFVRGATVGGADPWTFREDPVPGYVLESLICQSRSGDSTWTVNGAEASVRLAAEDLVTCTYLDIPQTEGIVAVRKITRGGTGGPFGFSVQPPSGPAQSFSASTTVEGEAEQAGSVTGGNGRYTITETLPPPSGAGTWRLTDAVCDGAETATNGTSIAVDASRANPATCTFVNTFTPAGEIRLSKTTHGGTGRFGYEVVPGPTTRIGENELPNRSIATTAQGVPVSATPIRNLNMGHYVVTEFAPPVPHGEWTSARIDCGPPNEVTLRNGQVEVTLTAEHPVAECRFVNTRTPPLPPTPGPTVSPHTATPRPPVRPAEAEDGGRAEVAPSTSPAPAQRASGGLPFTGLGLLALLAVALVAVVGGLLLLFPGYRRR